MTRTGLAARRRGRVRHEAEFNGGVAACSEGLFFKQIFEFFGYPTTMRVWMDASAARGIFQRQGVGRVRHLEAKCLWAQDALKQKKFEIMAVNTHENIADMGTKALPVTKHCKFKLMMNIVSKKAFEDGRVDEVMELWDQSSKSQLDSSS